jgi:hypothetical protein
MLYIIVFQTNLFLIHENLFFIYFTYKNSSHNNFNQIYIFKNLFFYTTTKNIFFNLLFKNCNYKSYYNVLYNQPYD